MKKQPKFPFLSVRKALRKCRKIVKIYNLGKDKKEQIRCGRKILIDELAYFYVKEWEAFEMQNGSPSEPIAFRTNRKALSNLTGLGESTIFENLQFLQDAGFLHKEFRGRELGFDIYLNPQLFFESEDVDNLVYKSFSDDIEVISFQNQKMLSFISLNSYVQILTHTNAKTKVKTINENVEKWINPQSEIENAETNAKKNFISSDDYMKFFEKSQTQGNQGADWVKSEKKGEVCPDFENQSKKYPHIKPENLKLLIDLSLKVWLYAKQKLYPNFRAYNDHAQDRIEQTILDYLVHEYHNNLSQFVSPTDYYLQLCKRIDIVQKYIQQGSEDKPRYVIAPVQYFDFKNTASGFIKTRRWYEENKAQSTRQKYDLLLQRAFKAFKTKKINKKTRGILEIYAHFEVLIKKQPFEDIKKAFYLEAQKFVSTQNVYHYA